MRLRAARWQWRLLRGVGARDCRLEPDQGRGDERRGCGLLAPCYKVRVHPELRGGFLVTASYSSVDEGFAAY